MAFDTSFGLRHQQRRHEPPNDHDVRDGETKTPKDSDCLGAQLECELRIVLTVVSAFNNQGKLP